MAHGTILEHFWISYREVPPIALYQDRLQGGKTMTIDQLFSLKGKTAVVTGGGRGLGRYMAIALAEAGADLVLGARHVEALEETAEMLKPLGTKIITSKLDVTIPDDVSRVVDDTLEHFGSIDILVNNSGTSWGAAPEAMPLEAWEKVFEVNVTGTFLMTQAVGQVMLAQGYGKIINIASVAGLGGIDPRIMDALAYNSSKGAVITMTRDLARKWGPRGIQVNAIAPGFFPTKMSQALITHRGEEILNATPLRRFGNENDIKGIVVLLASQASDFMTGAIVVVDGGTSA